MTAAQLLEAAPPGSKYAIRVGEGENCKVGYIKEPNRATMEVVLGMTMNMASNPQYIRAGEIILTNCWTGGDEEIRTNERLLITAAMQAFRAVEMEKAEIVKL